ncbi:MAG: response regulator transcription factor [Geobacteraceae bacterium]|nr:response regulator transcription factor [Geobacteraceae bacterium]
MTNRILIIDDDIELCELLNDYLSAEGFDAEAVHDGETGVERALNNAYGLIVLDVMLPRLSGFEVLRRIRTASAVPVLMLTARGDEVDRIVGLEMGADDYLPKPFNPRELVARLRAILRRAVLSMTGTEDSSSLLAVGDVSVDPGARSVVCGGNPVEVTSVEFSLLEVLLRMAGKVISREDLSVQALGRTLNYQDRSIDVHVSSLRKKLGTLSDGSERIKSVRGVGYIYTCPAAERNPEP